MRYFTFTISLVVALFAGTAYSQTFTTLLQFTGTGGATPGGDPNGSLTLSGATLYGMTTEGGAKSAGNIFSVGVDGSNYENIVSFPGTAAGGLPYGNVTVSGTTLYGMTEDGGTGGHGIIFSVGTDGTNYQDIVAFTGNGGTASGSEPWGSLILSGNSLYGMTPVGLAPSHGNIFSVGTDGTGFKNLVSFTGASGSAPGVNPLGNLTLGGTTLYGMTGVAGTFYGNVFSVGIDGTSYNNLVLFTGSSGTAVGIDPTGSLLLNGTTLYGMTSGGGESRAGNVFSVSTNGTDFQNLLSFTGRNGTANGEEPFGSLIISGTTLYGMTYYGGSYGEGNIFSLGVDGSGYQDLYDFSGGTDGANPRGDLTLSGGTLFGMTQYGGANGDGTLFALAGDISAPTPEPATLVLLSTAAAALTVSRWRRRQRVSVAADRDVIVPLRHSPADKSS